MISTSCQTTYQSPHISYTPPFLPENPLNTFNLCLNKDDNVVCNVPQISKIHEPAEASGTQEVASMEPLSPLCTHTHIHDALKHSHSHAVDPLESAIDIPTNTVEHNIYHAKDLPILKNTSDVDIKNNKFSSPTRPYM
eukprot:GHVR01044986.1.p1 GENE.GHVR01044986.1~~GHVR01044986.1.p1  ORF type:complete len:138 (+),score=23.17 GHVR01044986.1:498-911(+)